jgi:hypothetical protein
MLFSQVGLLGLLIAIGFIVQSNKTGTAAFEKSVGTPKSTPTKMSTPLTQKTGSVQTPAGRRSARLARRKED